MLRPLIGITLDWESAGGYSNFPWYALRENYCDAIADAGGVPITLPVLEKNTVSYLEVVDGLVITGGNFDVDPILFGENNRHEKVSIKQRRTNFEFAITQGAIHKNLPILGICGGQQLLNVVLGGTLIQHIPDEIKDAVPHEQPNPRDQAGHIIKVKPNTKLYEIVQSDTMSVNSAHHQAVKEIAKDVIVNAIALDGVIEGIEVPSKRFCLGVQWHPEFTIDPGDMKIFSALIDAAS